MQKIIFSSYDDISNPHYAGGGARAIHTIARECNREFQVEVITWKHSKKTKNTIDGVVYRRVGYHWIPPKVGMFIFQLILPIISLFASFDVWFESFGPPFTTSFLPLFTRKPVVGIVHMLAAADMKRKYKIDLSFIEKAGIRCYRQLIVTQKSVQKELQRLSPKTKCILIPNGIDLPKRLKLQKRKHILYVGRIEINQKGIDLLLEAYKYFRQNTKMNMNLVIAGNGGEAEVRQLLEMRSSHVFSKNIHFVGKVEGKKKEELFASAHCVIVPSRFETFSIVALEAFAHRTPLICFSIPGLSWIPKTIAIKVRAFQVRELSNAIENSLSNKKEQNEKIEQALRFATLFSWDNIVPKYMKVVYGLV